ncbi:unnamed protein product [Paramecium sonneborni]|uniref:Uncharacterized protein n=1 Tax=Paramecium sonneborni TaxID=65129 RepID=A0A8S1M4D9_9CILI|nr:unnamed protein product [Paramecium sonneborni]
MKRKSLFFGYGKHSSPDELIKHLNQCSVSPKFIKSKENVDLMQKNIVYFNNIKIKKSKSTDRDKSIVIKRSRLQKEYLRFLLSTDGPTGVFYQQEKKKLQIKIQDIQDIGQAHICLSKMLRQYQQELVNPF